MKNILILVFLVGPCLCMAQPDSGKWSQARNYLNYRLSLAAIRIKADKDASVAKLLNAASLPAYRIGQVPDYGVIRGELQKFTGVLQKLSDPVNRINLGPMEQAGADQGVSRLIDSAYFIVSRNYELESPAIVAATRVQLTGELKQYLAVAPAVASRPETAAADPSLVRRRVDSGVAASSASGHGAPVWLVVVLLVVVVGMGVYFYKALGKLSAEVRHLKRADKGVGLERRDVERIVGDSRAISDLNKAIESLQKQVFDLGVARSVVKPVVPAAPAPPPPPKMEAVRSDVFYMGGPVNDYFPNSVKSATKDNTVYKFKVSANGQEAAFELHTSGAPVAEIVKMAESYIKPACDEENLPIGNVKNIVTRKPGQAVLEGGRWVIKRKALIRYE